MFSVLCKLRIKLNPSKKSFKLENNCYWDVSKRAFKNFTLLTLGFPFAKLLRIFCGTKRKIFLSLRISFARKNNNLRNHSQKSFRAKLPFSAFAKLKFCAIPQLEFCAIPQFRKTQTVGDGVCFLEFNSGKILFWNVFLLVTFT